MNFRINDQVVVNEDQEAGVKNYIFYNIDEDRIFVINESAYEIYNLFGEKNSREQVCSILKIKYQLTEDEMNTVNEAISDLINKNILIECKR